MTLIKSSRGSDRKVRCDEKRTICNKCSATGRACLWASWIVPLRPSGEFQARRSQTVHTDHPLILENPRQNRAFPVNERVTMAVEFFARRTRNISIGSSFPPESLCPRWADYVMACCVDEPAVRYAVAAIGTFDEGTARVVHMSLPRPFDGHKWQLAMGLYLEALSQLQRLVQRAAKRASLIGAVLACCTMLFILELYVGNNADAVRHSRFGKRILQQRLAVEIPRPNTVMHYLYVGMALAESKPLSRGPIVVGRYACITPGMTSSVTRVHALSRLLARKMDLAERLEDLVRAAHEVQARLLDIVARHLEGTTLPFGLTAARRYCLLRYLSRSVPLDGDSNLIQDIRTILKAYEVWTSDMHAFLQGRRTSPALIMLQLRGFISNFNLATYRTTRECVLDRRQHSFDWALALVDAVDASLSREPFGHLTADSAAPVFEGSQNAGMFDFAIVSTLLIVACKSRKSSIRFKALELLQRARQVERISNVQLPFHMLHASARPCTHIIEAEATGLPFGAKTDTEGHQ